MSKVVTLLVGVCLGFPAMALAQQASASALSGASAQELSNWSVVERGLKVGTSLAKFRGNDADEADFDKFILSGGAGMYLRIGGGGRLTVQPEVILNFHGGGAEEDDDKLSARIGYIDVPVLARWNFSAVGRSAFAYGGPFFGVKLLSSIDLDCDSCSDESIEAIEEEIADEIESTNYGLVIGGGIPVGPGSAELRLTLGSKEVFDDVDGVLVGTWSIFFSMPLTAK